MHCIISTHDFFKLCLWWLHESSPIITVETVVDKYLNAWLGVPGDKATTLVLLEINFLTNMCI